MKFPLQFVETYSSDIDITYENHIRLVKSCSKLLYYEQIVRLSKDKDMNSPPTVEFDILIYIRTCQAQFDRIVNTLIYKKYFDIVPKYFSVMLEFEAIERDYKNILETIKILQSLDAPIKEFTHMFEISIKPVLDLLGITVIELRNYSKEYFNAVKRGNISLKYGEILS